MMLIMLFLCDPTNLSVFFLDVVTGCVAIKISAKTSRQNQGLGFHRQSFDPCHSVPLPVVWYGPKKI